MVKLFPIIVRAVRAMNGNLNEELDALGVSQQRLLCGVHIVSAVHSIKVESARVSRKLRTVNVYL